MSVTVHRSWLLPLLGSCALIGCNGAKQREESPHTAPATAPAPSAAVSPVAFKPIEYFDQNCSRCHGPYGSFYGDAFGRGLTDEKLRHVIADMAAGPGNAPLGEAELEVQTAYHRSLLDRRPFVVVNAIEANGDRVTMAGEVSPDSVVFVGADRANVKGHAWDVVLPPTVEPSRVVLRVAGKSGSTSLSLGESAYSHAHAGVAD